MLFFRAHASRNGPFFSRICMTTAIDFPLPCSLYLPHMTQKLFWVLFKINQVGLEKQHAMIYIKGLIKAIQPDLKNLMRLSGLPGSDVVTSIQYLFDSVYVVHVSAFKTSGAPCSRVAPGSGEHWLNIQLSLFDMLQTTQDMLQDNSTKNDNDLYY